MPDERESDGEDGWTLREAMENLGISEQEARELAWLRRHLDTPTAERRRTES